MKFENNKIIKILKEFTKERHENEKKRYLC
jgi:hypothetical protein